MAGQHEDTGSEYEIDATRQMFELDDDSYSFVLSNSAKRFIEENDLGTFSIRFDVRSEWLKIVAPNDHARTMFRLAF